MKLKNKKTGEVIDSLQRSELILDYSSLAELNEEWEDYEEQKEYWSINEFGTLVQITHSRENIYDKSRKNFGNYFETKEEAEKAVEKIKAWKRLKDKGTKIINYECYGGTDKKGEFLGEVKVTIDVPQEVDKYLFETLFGGGE